MEKKQVSVGAIVKSLAGHDEGRLYIVVAQLNPEFVLLADGDKRKIENPKQKRVKHLRILTEGDDGIKLNDITIKRKIKIFYDQKDL